MEAVSLAAPGRRQSVRLVRPAAQLKLPGYLLLVSLGFSLLFALHGYAAYERIYASTMSVAPSILEQVFAEQTADFLFVTALLGVGYAAAVLAFGVAYLHRLLGPLVALRRHVQALRRGDYETRTVLRRDETVFAELTADLNLLSEALNRRQNANHAR